MIWRSSAISLALTASLLAGGLDTIRKEPDPLRRFELALTFAETQARAARQLVKDSGSRTELLAQLDDVDAAAVLALESLQATGKRPNKLTRQYKKGEVKTLDIIRLLDDLVLALGLEDRPAAQRALDRATVTHEEFLLGVMSGK